MSLVQSTI